MFRQYWIEFATLMLMTGLLFASFAFQGAPAPKTSGLQKRLNPYTVAKSSQPWIEFDYSDSKKSNRAYRGTLLADGHWKYVQSGKPHQPGTPAELSTPGRSGTVGQRETVSGTYPAVSGVLVEQSMTNLMRRAEREAAIEWRKDKMRPLDPTKQKLPTELAKLSIHFYYPGGDYQYQVAWYGKNFEYTPEQRKFLRMWAELLTEMPSPLGDKPIDFLGQ